MEQECPNVVYVPKWDLICLVLEMFASFQTKLLVERKPQECGIRLALEPELLKTAMRVYGASKH